MIIYLKDTLRWIFTLLLVHVNADNENKKAIEHIIIIILTHQV